MILLVTYDLHNPERDYEDVIKAIKTADSWAHPQGSVWLIDTLISPADWIKKLKTAGDSNDEYLVAQLRKHWAARNMGPKVVKWLKSSDRRW